MKIVNPKFKLSVIPVISFNADKIDYLSTNKSVSIKISDFKSNVRLLPLLGGNINVNSLSMKNLDISACANHNWRLDKNFFVKLNNSNFKLQNLKIDKFNAELKQKNIDSPIIYYGQNLFYQKHNQYNKFKIISTLKLDKKLSAININFFFPKNGNINNSIFDINIQNIDIEPLKDCLKIYLPDDLKNLKGIINITANKNVLITEFTNFEAIMNDSAKSIIFPKQLIVKSKFKIKKQAIDFENIDINSEHIHLGMKGKIFDYIGNSMPTLNLNLQINNSRIEDFVKLMPVFKIEELDSYKLKKYMLYGNVIGNIAIKGRCPEPNITGSIYANDCILEKPIKNAKGTTIKVKLNGKDLNFDVHVPAGNAQYVDVKGNAEIYNVKYSNLTIKSTDNVDLATAKSVLDPLHEIINFVIGPIPILDLKGTGNINAVVKGNRKSPHIWGQMNFKDTSANFIQIPDLILKDADAILTFNDTDTEFKTLKGVVNQKKCSIVGKYNLSGKFNFYAESKDQSTDLLYKAIKSSAMLADITKFFPNIENVNGLIDSNLKIYGNLKYIEDLKFNENVFAKGDLTLKNNSLKLQNIDIEKINGKILFDALDANIDLKAVVSESPLTILAKIKNNIGDIKLNIPKFNPNFLVSDNKIKNKNYFPLISVIANYKGNMNEIDYSDLNFNAKVIEPLSDSQIKFTNGEIDLRNNNLLINNLKGYIDDTQNAFDVALNIKNVFSEKYYNANGKVNIKSKDVSLLNRLFLCELIPEKFRDILKQFEFKKGSLYLNCDISNNKIHTNADLSGISIEYIPLELPITILNGNFSVRNNNMYLSKINLLADKMPVLLDGQVQNVFVKPKFDIYINSKPQQEFIDKYINKKQIYPIKIKGDIVYWLKFKGFQNNYELKSNVYMNKNSSFYHYGATVGDVENDIVLNLDSRVVDGNFMKVKEFSYDKIIDSLNSKKTNINLLKANGGIMFLNNDVEFKDLHIKTTHPTDARIFNIIFRKANIKDGQFVSDLKFNQKLSNPKIIGDFHIVETNIPFLDTVMKNIELKFTEKDIFLNSKGEIMGNTVTLKGVMKNKFSAPYHLKEANVYTKNLNLNTIAENVKTSQLDDETTFNNIEKLDINNLIIDNLKIKADKIELRNIDASDFSAHASIDSDNRLKIKHFDFKVANGIMNGKYLINLNNNNMNLNLHARDINANDISIALFGLNNQIYGNLTGEVTLSCNGVNFDKCMNTLNGETKFNVNDGRMPKLGSLEYLLKAGNLIKGGITGISINSIIDIITPLKTGEFSDIFGFIEIKDGIAENIEIATKGKDLNLYINGVYNFGNSEAEMVVLGLLSRKITTLFGQLGNFSINTLFNIIPGVDLSKDSSLLENINKIPGIELSNKNFRKFVAEIKGNINGEGYVKSFKWIN